MNGRLIKQWLEERGKSREALAVELGVSIGTIQRILSGRYIPPRTTIIALMYVLGVSESDLLNQPGAQRDAG
jgi:transcriptional regulator with XRE-family HTH domain